MGPPPTCPGTRDGTRKSRKENSPARLWSKLSTPSFPPPGPLTSLFDFHSRMSTRSVVLELCPSVESKLVSSDQVSSPLLLPPSFPLKSSPLKCTTSPSLRPFPVTMLDSTSRTYPSRISDEVTSPLTPRMTLLEVPSPLLLRSLSLTTPVRSETAALQSWIATLLTS